MVPLIHKAQVSKPDNATVEQYLVNLNSYSKQDFEVSLSGDLPPNATISVNPPSGTINPLSEQTIVIAVGSTWVQPGKYDLFVDVTTILYNMNWTSDDDDKDPEILTQVDKNIPLTFEVLASADSATSSVTLAGQPTLGAEWTRGIIVTAADMDGFALEKGALVNPYDHFVCRSRHQA